MSRSLNDRLKSITQRIEKLYTNDKTKPGLLISWLGTEYYASVVRYTGPNCINKIVVCSDKSTELNKLIDVIDLKLTQSVTSHPIFTKSSNISKQYPPFITKTNKAIYYYKDAAGTILHRTGDLPAVEHINGKKEWYKDGNRHRDNDPAIIYKNYIAWYKGGKLHNPLGYSSEFKYPDKNYTNCFHINGKQFNTKLMDLAIKKCHGQVEMAFDWVSKPNILFDNISPIDYIDLDFKNQGKVEYLLNNISFPFNHIGMCGGDEFCRGCKQQTLSYFKSDKYLNYAKIDDYLQYDIRDDWYPF